MQRRDFLHTAAAGALTWLEAPGHQREAYNQFGSQSGSPTDGSTDYRLALAAAEVRLRAALSSQILDPRHVQSGGFLVPAYGFAYPASTAAEATHLGALYSNADSRFHRRAELGERLALALGYLEREQHADGTIDLPTTNFHSPPDTAFVVEDLVLLYRLLERDDAPSTGDWRRRLEGFLRRATAAIAGGGIHTPNHRWVAVAALAGAYRLFREPAWLRRIEAWLAEGIDCNADGEYTELSNAVYNRVTNRALLTAAEALDRPALLDPVRRNLGMMLYCVHPDGEIVTDYSRRQDRLTRARLGGYYLHYRVMSLKDGDGRFATMADRIADEARRNPAAATLAGELGELMLRPELRDERVARASLPTDYLRHFRESGAVRLRRAELSATIVSGSSRFLALRRGAAVLEGVRVASAFFGKGQFISPTLQPEGDGWRLQQTLEAWYNQPLPPEAGLPNPTWSDLDHRKRARSHVCRLETVIIVREIEAGVEISIDSSGTERVPLVVEFWLRPGGRLTAGSGGELMAANGTTFLTSGSAEYRTGKDLLRIGPGLASHRWAQLRGAEPPLAEAVPLTIAGFTPFRHVVRVMAA